MTKRNDTRRLLLETAYELFYRKGFGRVGMDMIAEQAAVTKRTIYYHFRSKDELLGAVLEQHHEFALERIRQWSAQLSGDVDGLIDGIFNGVAAWAAQQPRWMGAGFTRLAMELADLPGHPARSVARRHKAAIEDWLAGELRRRRVDQPQEHARRIALLLEGCMVLMLIHGDKTYSTSAAAAAKLLVACQRAQDLERRAS
jgi:AcrR family transcriptional regulator